VPDDAVTLEHQIVAGGIDFGPQDLDPLAESELGLLEDFRDEHVLDKLLEEGGVEVLIGCAGYHCLPPEKDAELSKLAAPHEKQLE
jgi:hypothetical protein